MAASAPIPEVPSFPGAQAPGEALRLQGAGVVLERLDPAEHGADLTAAALADSPERWAWMAVGPWAEAAAFQEWLAACAASSAAAFYAIRPEGGSAAGVMSYMRFDPPHRVGEIGSIWLSRSLAGGALATAAFAAMMRHAFEDLGLRRLEWKCDSRNLPSRQAALRLGFVEEGLFRQHMIVKGRNRDTAWFSMLDGEWPRARAAFGLWLAPENFDAEGRRRRSLAEIRESLT
ncbi:GNAT family protein [Neomegalonema sp.]|uniref:GNAT family N-acetyltransferase n=1 Tax=Neomegalonema sp. TaxID=2039713 RepID=UPI002616C17F|nr:GNAT family protein [Neomegalonema sp.]MDD2867504.1 GNAT family protein [Neomegalonema sp.]